MTISVVVIGFNIEDYVERCLDSIFAQTYENYEVIFVNDGSTDNTMKIVREYQKKYKNMSLVDKDNGGIISARKAGVEKSSGDYIAFVDGDDYINEDMLSIFAEAVGQTEGGYDIVMSDHYEERPNGRMLVKKSDCCLGEMEGDRFLLGILDGTINHYMFAKIYRKAFLDQRKYSAYPNITIAEDLLTNSVLGLYRPKVLYIDKVNYYYQFNEKSVTRDGKLSMVDKQIHTFKLMKRKFSVVSDDRYNDYLDFQWYLFAMGYLQTGYSHKFKKYLISKCRYMIKGVSRNKLFREQKMNLSVFYGRVLLFFYMYLPFCAAIVNICFRLMIDLLHKTGMLKKY